MAKKSVVKKAVKKAAKKSVAKKSVAAPRLTAAARLAAVMEQPREPASISDWFEARMNAASATGAATGACIVPNPTGGANMCIPTDRATCKLMKGFFAGGAC